MCRSNDSEAYQEYDGDYAEPWRDPAVLRELYHDQQLTQKEIAEHFGAGTRRAVAREMRKNNIETRPPNGSGVPSEKLRRLYWDEGLTVREVGNRVGLCTKTVSERMERHGIERRSAGVAVHD
jgi:DNA-binding transcriptional regulator LsrR (DeoR family)